MKKINEINTESNVACRYVTSNFFFFFKDVISLSKKSQDAKPLEFDPVWLEDFVRKMAPLLKGKDGRDGKDGKDGRDGRDGLRVNNTS